MYGKITSKASNTSITPSLPPANVTNFTAEAGDTQITLIWNDPDDVENGVWAGTKIVRKVGGYPASVNDGTLVVNSTVRNQYSTNGFIDTGLTNGVIYYYQAFPYSDKGKVNINAVNRVSTIVKTYWVLGVAIDETNSNPETAVTYTDDAVGMTPASHGDDGMMVTGQEFLDLFKVRPCVLGNGVVQYYLNPNNYNEKEDGGESDLTGADGNVMVEIPKIGYKFNRVGSVLNVQLTNESNKDGFCYLAHTRGSTVMDKLYVGAYLGHESDGKLLSVSGVMPTGENTIGDFRTLAKANGTGYDQLSFYPLTLLQCMYLIMYKNLNSQTALGRGRVGTDYIITGGTNAKGMCFGEQTDEMQMKFLGIEDFWGNLYQWIDGVYIDGEYYNSVSNILTATENFNDTGDGYPYTQATGTSGENATYLSKTQGTNNGGFYFKEGNGSETTYYSDFVYIYGERVLVFGGQQGSYSEAGAFHFVNRNSSDHDRGKGTRLMYLRTSGVV